MNIKLNQLLQFGRYKFINSSQLMLVTLSPKGTRSATKLNFTLKSEQYNQYVQTHMSLKEEKYLTQQQKEQIPVNAVPFIPKPNKLQHSKKPKKNSPLIPMPITQFELSKMNSSDLSDDDDIKTSVGLSKQKIQFMNRQQSSRFQHILITRSIETQTDDFTFISNLFSEPKIYEIPVEMEVQESGTFQQRGIQVSQILLQGLLQKLQQPKPAVLTQPRLQMNSAVLSMSVQNYSFQKSQQFNQKAGSGFSIHQNNDNDSEQIDKGLQSEEMLLQNESTNQNKQNLFKTANFQYPYTQIDFYTVSTPQKSRISGSQSSPDTNGPMRISETQVNMMHTRHVVSSKIDEEEYEDLQSRFYILEQENAQKVDQIEALNKKLKDLATDLQELQSIDRQKENLQEKCHKLEKQLQNKTQQIEKVSETLFSAQQELSKLRQSSKYKQNELYEILQTKQKQIEQIQNELKSYRDHLASGQEKYSKQNEAFENYFTEKEQQITDLKAEYDRKYELYILSIKEMKQKIQQYELKMENLENVITKKDAKINEYKDEFLKLREENSILCKRIQNQQSSSENMHQQQGTISISESHQFNKFASYSFQKPSKRDNVTSSNIIYLEEYSHELQKIILTYENVIERQLQTIEELEEKVLEFLKDALTKESEAELLCSQLFQYENNLNGLMVEKLNMELENQRLNKIITESQNKLAVLGSRLIRLAKTNSSLSSRNEEHRNPSSSSSIEEPSQR